MRQSDFRKQSQQLFRDHEKLIRRRNRKVAAGNGVFDRYQYPVLTAEHTPLFWRYDFDPRSNPYLQERMGINSVFNAGAIEHNGKIAVIARVEGVDRKSFFSVADSPNGIDNFRFWTTRSVCPKPRIRTSTSMTYAWSDTRTAGFTASSARSGKIRPHPHGTPLLRSHNVESSAPRI